MKIETVLQDDMVERAVNTIITNASSGKIGDGKMFLYKVEEAIRIRSQERGAAEFRCLSYASAKNVTTTGGEMRTSVSRRTCL